MAIDWSGFRDILRRHNRFVLTSHVRPDADAIGSELGLAAMLRDQGKAARIVNASRTPPRLTWLDPQRQVLHLGSDVRREDLADAEVVAVLDTSAWQQLGEMADYVRQSPAPKVVIDHHLSADDLGAHLFKEEGAAATGELVFQLAEYLDIRLTPEIANPLFAAVATDTGWFRFSSVRGETLRIAGRLVDAGARVDKLYEALYERDTLARLKLMGLSLERMRLERQGRVALTEIHRDDFLRTGAWPPDTEELVNHTLTIAGVEAGLIFIEQLQGGVKVSFRSRGAIDCHRWAKTFGGGGHLQAAGAILPDPLPEAIARVLAAMPVEDAQ